MLAESQGRLPAVSQGRMQSRAASCPPSGPEPPAPPEQMKTPQGPPGRHSSETQTPTSGKCCRGCGRPGPWTSWRERKVVQALWKPFGRYPGCYTRPHSPETRTHAHGAHSGVVRKDPKPKQHKYPPSGMSLSHQRSEALIPGVPTRGTLKTSRPVTHARHRSPHGGWFLAEYPASRGREAGCSCISPGVIRWDE